MNSQSWHKQQQQQQQTLEFFQCKDGVLKHVVIFWRLKTDPTIYFSDFSRLAISLLIDYLNVQANLSLYILLHLT